ncbi:hypothetical protein ACFO6W_26215, partial [Dysgonomonas termitidis]
LCQDVKRKQALLGSNLSAINILTVRGNATWEAGFLPLFLSYRYCPYGLKNPILNPSVNRLSTAVSLCRKFLH